MEDSKDNILYKEKVGYLKSTYQLLYGTLHITQNTLVLISNKTTLASGILGYFIKKKIESKKYGFHLDLSKIKHFERGKHGAQTNVLVIYDDSNTSYKILVNDYAVWESLLSNH